MTNKWVCYLPAGQAGAAAGCGPRCDKRVTNMWLTTCTSTTVLAGQAGAAVGGHLHDVPEHAWPLPHDAAVRWPAATPAGRPRKGKVLLLGCL